MRIDQKHLFLTLLDDILRQSKAQNITAGELAVRAGITPETLSRMKKRGTGDFATLNNMAMIVGLRFTLVPDNAVLEAITSGHFFS